ncbi:hypothetical protein [Microbacterium lacus]|uniref:hypothetical protein n=1 Tax=Microbacterium lacus TaxID=415217 RepID=UPI000C2BE258|nr:hypothetical protein [Microbacterium lacus]
MSLLDRRAPHVVYVQNRKTERDNEGKRIMVDVGPRIAVRCMHEPVRDWSSAEETPTLGLQVTDLKIIRSRLWPGDIHSHVYFDGGVHETVGAPQAHSVSRRTRHHRITVRWIAKEE